MSQEKKKRDAPKPFRKKGSGGREEVTPILCFDDRWAERAQERRKGKGEGQFPTYRKKRKSRNGLQQERRGRGSPTREKRKKRKGEQRVSSRDK